MERFVAHVFIVEHPVVGRYNIECITYIYTYMISASHMTFNKVFTTARC